MKLLSFAILLSVLSGCATAPQKGSAPLYKDSSRYDVTCVDRTAKDGIQTYKDVKIGTHYVSSIELETLLKSIWVQKSECLFIRQELVTVPSESARIGTIYEVSCDMGPVHFSEKDLQLVDEDNGFYIARKTNGKLSALPKKRCMFNKM